MQIDIKNEMNIINGVYNIPNASLPANDIDIAKYDKSIANFSGKSLCFIELMRCFYRMFISFVVFDQGKHSITENTKKSTTNKNDAQNFVYCHNFIKNLTHVNKKFSFCQVFCF